ncbi:uncharacterized protein K452DRAFT_284411 [Aplosporella prunicola CBS 121167]|uniref:CID domain-containing protein n=1 Tax=Aplosporella prunicola CBS 121167 TaxID=1176127 RepID=A0A6A6BMW9_9PEZI|nr:uncharacterized protein K452DRAFT_284411 [Aplosporella prunicola CBS 121167]KAF2145018.1 hypothetical protein K452DRAFT_284411 [Aplosporella prunicola CBS 121167]
MSKEQNIRGFPDITDKLSAPTKKSLWERQREEAEAKRLREEAESQAALEELLKEHGGGNDTLPSSGTGGRMGPTGGVRGALGGGARRHFPPTGPRGNSGPGTLGQPPSSLTRKRPFEDEDQGIFALKNASAAPLDAATAFQTSDDEDADNGSKSAERAAPKPTMRLTSLPPTMTQADIRRMIPSNLVVESVRLTPELTSTDRRSNTAIVTLATDTPAKEIDAVVNALDKRYLGWGFKLSISRHLSSAALGAPTAALPSSISSSHPFGAKVVAPAVSHGLSRAPPPSSYAPGSSSAFGRAPAPTQVLVKPPSDIKQLKLINKTLEGILTYGPEFEALLMARPDIQRDQKWQWLWNPCSQGAVWYRWRLWEVITGSDRAPRRRNHFANPAQQIFEGGAPWLGPEERPPFEFTTKFEELVSDPDYSSEDDLSDDENKRRQHNASKAPPESGIDIDQARKSYLNPLQKAKLVHMLARLPTSAGKLRRGDVARVSSFAISHADKGAEEIVHMLISNIEKPFALSGANPDRQKNEEEAEKMDRDDGVEKKAEKEDPSDAKKIGLYLIGDVFASCGTCGVRQAWRYREWFESAFKKRKVFEHLGRLDRDMQWGRLRAERWKSTINNILSMWEKQNVFPSDAQARFIEAFNNSPMTEEEKKVTEQVEQGSSNTETKPKWKTLDVAEAREENQSASAPATDANEQPDGDPMVESNLDGEPMEDVDGEPMADVDGEPMADVDGESMKDFDGEPMEKDTGGEPREEKAAAHQAHLTQAEAQDKGATVGETEAAKARRRRPRAEDMFADSD